MILKNLYGACISRYFLYFILFVSCLLSLACGSSFVWAVEKQQHLSVPITYIHWENLPAGILRAAFENQGNKLINNLNLVSEQGNKPILIRGGGFTPAGLDWLVNDIGVRTVIDLRGRFSDDKTEQLIIHSPELLATYTKNRQLDRLKNLSPDKTQVYLQQLAQQKRINIQYLNLKAEDPILLTYLNTASPQKPLAMFCQWGVNRSGTAWGVYAAKQGWSLEQAIAAFGVKKTDGSYRNIRDIEYGYRLEQARLKAHKN